jgi:hypothetical protein
MKKFLLAVVVFTLVLGCFASAYADTPVWDDDSYNSTNDSWEDYDYVYPFAQYESSEYYGEVGVIISTNASVRSKASTNTKRYTQLKNGDEILILDRQGDWYVIDVTYNDMTDLEYGTVGYVLCNLVTLKTHGIYLNNVVNTYQDPWLTSAPNGTVTGEVLVLSENKYFYCIQKQNGRAGSAFIKKADVYYWEPEKYDVRNYKDVRFAEVDTWVYCNNPVNLYVDPWGSGMRNGERSSEAFRVISENSRYYCVVLNNGGVGTSYILKEDLEHYSGLQPDGLFHQYCYVTQNITVWENGEEVELEKGSVVDVTYIDSWQQYPQLKIVLN